MEYPRMVYRAGGDVVLESGRYTTRIVANAEEHERAKAEGFHLDQYAAKAAVDTGGTGVAPVRVKGRRVPS